MATPAIVGGTIGFPGNYGQHIQNAWSNNQGDKVYVNPTAGNALVIVVIGTKSFQPFDLFHNPTTVSPAGWAAGLYSFQPTAGTNVVVTDTAGVHNTYTPASGSVVDGDSDYTVSVVPPVAPNPWPSSTWALDSRYPTIFMFYALNVAGGPYYIDVNSCYQDGISSPADLAAGKPVFDGGVDIHVFEFSGIVTAAAGDASAGAMTSANPATVTYTTGTSGDILITAGYMKSGNVFSAYAPAGTTGTLMLATGKGVSTQAHWGIEMQLQTAAGAISPGFTNPLGYEMAVVSIALKHA